MSFVNITVPCTTNIVISKHAATFKVILIHFLVQKDKIWSHTKSHLTESRRKEDTFVNIANIKQKTRQAYYCTFKSLMIQKSLILVRTAYSKLKIGERWFNTLFHFMIKVNLTCVNSAHTRRHQKVVYPVMLKRFTTR